VFGIASGDADDTDPVTVLVAGDVADDDKTGLGAGTSRVVVTDAFNGTSALTCKLRRIDDFDPASDAPVRDVFVVGTVDENGNLAVLPHHYSEETGYRRTFSARAYGATADGLTACDAAFKKMFAAMQSTQPTTAGPKTCLAIAELGQGQFLFEDNLVLPGNCTIAGVSNVQSGSAASTQLLFATGKGIIVPNNADPRLGATTGCVIRNLHISCDALEVEEWQPEGVYAIGDIVLLPHSHEYVYECVRAGNSQAPPGTAVQWFTPNTPAVTDLVYGAFLDGHLYECEVSGAVGMDDPFVPLARTWREGLRTEDDAAVWKEAGVWPGLKTAAEVALCIGDSTGLENLPGPPNPRYVWTSGQNYNIGDVVLVLDGGAVIPDAVWCLLPVEGVQTEGGIAGVGPGGGWDPDPGVRTNDGTLEWTAVAGNFYLWEDNDCLWVARAHAGIYAQRTCTIENVDVTGSTTAKIHLRATDFPPSSVSDWRITNAKLSGGKGPGMVVAGTESNAGVGTAVHVNGTTTGEPENPFREWDLGIRDGSFLASTWVGCHLEYIGGYGYRCDSVGQSSFLGCYLEGTTGGVFAPNGVIVGGALGASPDLTESSYPVVLASQQCLNLLTANTNPYDDPGIVPPPNTLRVTIGCTQRELRACMPLSFHANSEVKQTGWAWSTEITRREFAYPLGDPPKNGWWIFGYDIHEQGTANAAYATSGPTADAMRDVPPGAAGMFWVTQDHLFLGFGNTEPNCIKRGTSPPVAGVWVMGDRILNTDPIANGFAGWVCTEGGGVGTWEPYGALESTRAELSLAANFTTDSSGATSTNLSFEVRAGETWLLEFEGLAECSSIGGVKYAIAAPALTTVAGWLDGTDSSLNDRVVEAIAAANTLTANPIHRVAATPGPDRIVATIVAGDDGVVALQAASGVNMELTTIFAGATLRASRAATV